MQISHNFIDKEVLSNHFGILNCLEYNLPVIIHSFINFMVDIINFGTTGCLDFKLHCSMTLIFGSINFNTASCWDYKIPDYIPNFIIFRAVTIHYYTDTYLN